MSEENKNLPPQPGNNGGDDHFEEIEQFISEASTAVTNGQEPSIEVLLAKFGYGSAVLKSAEAKLTALSDLNRKQRKEKGEETQAYKDYEIARGIAHSKYINHLAIARIVFKTNYTAQRELHLPKERKKSISGYLTEATDFYTVLDKSADYKAAIAAKGVSQADITNGIASYTQLIALNKKKAKEGGEGQVATAERDAAYDELQTWYSEFKVIGSIALESVPQLREKLGWLER